MCYKIHKHICTWNKCVIVTLKQVLHNQTQFPSFVSLSLLLLSFLCRKTGEESSSQLHSSLPSAASLYRSLVFASAPAVLPLAALPPDVLLLQLRRLLPRRNPRQRGRSGAVSTPGSWDCPSLQDRAPIIFYWRSDHWEMHRSSSSTENKTSMPGSTRFTRECNKALKVALIPWDSWNHDIISFQCTCS